MWDLDVFCTNLNMETVMEGFSNPITNTQCCIIPGHYHNNILDVAGLHQLQHIGKQGSIPYWQQRLWHILRHQRVHGLRQTPRQHHHLKIHGCFLPHALPLSLQTLSQPNPPSAALSLSRKRLSASNWWKMEKNCQKFSRFSPATRN